DSFFHTWKDGKSKYPAFLDDYAYLVEALLLLHQVSADTEWLKKARSLTEHVIQEFSEDDGPYFYYTHRNQKDVILRKREMYDGATPSGNSIMASNILQLAMYFDLTGYRERSFQMVHNFSQPVISYPTSFAAWAGVILQLVYPPLEIAILGPGYSEALKELN